MKKLITECGNPHNYLWLKQETVILTEPVTKTLQKNIYACDDCGKGLEIYDLDNPTLTEELPE